ncbi:hypothetical protein Zmor_008161 [Zophobas morio]|uniref:Uncharacterized protein n=1 Tax=Zophobas morio TaxID=2755281 RepID=A0AA38IYD8_9CUCU|nr:hypothetical protein Zmor_008161 [Zophobas morio]
MRLTCSGFSRAGTTDLVSEAIIRLTRLGLVFHWKPLCATASKASSFLWGDITTPCYDLESSKSIREFSPAQTLLAAALQSTTIPSFKNYPSVSSPTQRKCCSVNHNFH